MCPPAPQKGQPPTAPQLLLFRGPPNRAMRSRVRLHARVKRLQIAGWARRKTRAVPNRGGKGRTDAVLRGQNCKRSRVIAHAQLLPCRRSGDGRSETAWRGCCERRWWCTGISTSSKRSHAYLLLRPRKCRPWATRGRQRGSRDARDDLRSTQDASVSNPRHWCICR